MKTSIVLLTFFACTPAAAQYYVTTVAGGAGNLTPANIGGPATNAPLGTVSGLAVDAAGNLYASNIGNYPEGLVVRLPEDQVVMRIDHTGTLSIVAGIPGPYGGYSGDGGLAVNAQLDMPSGLAFDAGGNLYVADMANGRVRRIGTDGKIFDVAGNGSFGAFSGDGGPAVYAALNYPNGVAADSAGNLYIADTDNCRIRKVDSNGIISTLAGNGLCAFSGDGGPASSASLSDPQDIVLDAAGNLYISDYNNQRIRKIDTRGIISTIAGTGFAVTSGDGGPATSAGLIWPVGLAVDGGGNIYFASDARVRKITASGTISTVAGNGGYGYSGDGGPATAAQISHPDTVTVDANGNLYVGGGDGRIRLITPDGLITTFAGYTPTYYNSAGQATSVGFTPYVNNVLAARDGGFYVAIYGQLLKVAPSGTIGVAAGNGVSAFSGDGGPAVSAQVEIPYGMVEDSAGNLFFTDSTRIRKIDSNGIITTVAGNGTLGYAGDGGPATSAELSATGVAVDQTGNLYIADTGNHRVRMVTPQGIISTFAGTGVAGYSGDGGPASAAKLSAPNSLTMDAQGNLYIVDATICQDVNCPNGAGGENRVRKVDPNGVITTFAGNGIGGWTGDGGPASSAALCFPNGVTVDPEGNVFILDAGNQVVRKVDAGGNISTVSLVSANGSVLLDLSTSDYSKGGGGISADANGSLYIADYFDAVVLKAALVANAALSSADYSPLVAPGSLVTVFGANLATQTATLSPPLTNSPDGTTVTLGTLPAPVLYLSSTQINLQVPFDAPIGTQTVNVLSPMGVTNATVLVVAAAPAIFRTGGVGIITNLTGELLNSPGLGALPGDYITIWCTGLGDVTNRPPAGAAPPSGPPYSQTIQTPTVIIGGVPATVLYSGLAPGFVGLYQVNVQVPAKGLADVTVPVSVFIGSVFDTVTLNIL